MGSQEKGESCGREKDVLIYAPRMSFLEEEEARWIVSVNLHNFWDRDAESDYTEATKRIISLLHQYLDALQKDPETRVIIFKQITQEINENLKSLNRVIVPNPLYSPGSDPTDPSKRFEAKPFLLGDLESVAGMYMSLVRFIVGRYLSRLGRCQICGSLFLAPDDRTYENCPETPTAPR